MKTHRRYLLLLLVLSLLCPPAVANAAVKTPPTTSTTSTTSTKSTQTAESQHIAALQRILDQIQPALDAGKLDTALELITQAILLQPGVPLFRTTRADIRMELTDYSGALVDASYALSLQPTAYAYDQRAWALRSLARYDLALLDHARALETEPTSRNLNNRAMTLMHLGRYAEALTDIDQALNLDPGQPTLLTNRAAALRGLARYDETLTVVEQALETWEHPHPLTVYALTLYALGREKDAAKASARCVALGGDAITAKTVKSQPSAIPAPQPTRAPKDPQAQSDKLVASAKEALNAQDPAKAIDLLNQAIAVNPQDMQAFYWRGLAYSYESRLQEMLEDLAYALSLDSPATTPDIMLVTNFASALMFLGYTEESLVEMHRAVQIGPVDTIVLRNRGNAYYNLERYEEALADYNMAMALEPRDAQIWLYRAETNMELKRYDEALADLNKANDLAPANSYFKQVIEENLATLASLKPPVKNPPTTEPPKAEKDPTAPTSADQAEILRTNFFSLLHTTALKSSLSKEPTSYQDNAGDMVYKPMLGMVLTEEIGYDNQIVLYDLMLGTGFEVYQQADLVYSTFLRTMLDITPTQATALYTLLHETLKKSPDDGTRESILVAADGYVRLTYDGTYVHLAIDAAACRLPQ